EFRLQARQRSALPANHANDANEKPNSATNSSGSHSREFALFAGTIGGSNVPLQHATADFNQSGWEIDKALDGNLKTAWGIYPEVGKSHFGVFETKSDLGFQSGTRLTFTIEQQHGGGHLIGRVRLSITSSPRPVRAKSI